MGRKESLFIQLVASMLIDLIDDLELYESNTVDFSNLLEEVARAEPDIILLEESPPFSENSLLIRLLANIPDLPVIVISEDSNLMHIVRRETRLLSSSHDLVKTITHI